MAAWTDDLTPEWASHALGLRVARLTVRSPRELEQSEVCVLEPELEEQGEHQQQASPGQILLKRYNLRRLMARIPKPEAKWRVTATSFINEFEFLRAGTVLAALQRFLAPHGVPRVLYTAGRVSDSDWFDRSYDLAFELLPSPPFYQASQLDLPQATAVMQLLGRFHAFFWRGSTGSIQAQDSSDAHPATAAAAAAQWAGVYPRGAWWRKALRPSVEYGKLPATFQSLCAAFPDPSLFGQLDTRDAHAAMTRMANSVDALNQALAEAPDRTLVHGDIKTSNVFFRRDEDSLRAFAIDFQWTGRAPSGLADVVYCLYGGVAYEVVAQHEAELLAAYWAALEAGLVERGLAPGMQAPPAWRSAHWAAEVVAYTMTALPQLLDGLTPALCRANQGKYGWLTHEFDARCAVLLCERALEQFAVVEAACGPHMLLLQSDGC